MSCRHLPDNQGDYLKYVQGCLGGNVLKLRHRLAKEAR